MKSNVFHWPYVRQIRQFRRQHPRQFLLGSLCVAWIVTSLIFSMFQETSVSAVMFNPLAGKSKATADAQYKQAVQAIQRGDGREALHTLQSLEAVFPGYRPLLLLHEAEAAALTGDESLVQHALGQILHLKNHHTLKPLAQYRLAQSLLRSRREAAALTMFQTLQHTYPQTEYAIGALYYMGLLAKRPEYWAQYLTLAPTGRFANEILAKKQQALSLLVQARAYARAKNWQQALRCFKQASQQDHEKLSATDRLLLAETLIQSNHLNNNTVAQGRTLIEANLAASPDAETTERLVDLVIQNQQKTGWLKTMMAYYQKPFLGWEYLAWKLGQLDPAMKGEASWWILKNAPQSDYAPESRWFLLWQAVQSGQYGLCVDHARQFLAHYPSARSAPKAMFWQGKCLERGGQAEQAAEVYQSILASYPQSYYAFRASGRLKSLRDKQPDPAWRLLATSVDLSDTKNNAENSQARETTPEQLLDTLSQVLSSKADFINDKPLIVALARSHAFDDARLLGHELSSEKTKPNENAEPLTGTMLENAMLESALLALEGNRTESIRVLRQALARSSHPYQLSKLEMQLMYPRYFQDLIRQEASRNGLPPDLITGLMREESHFQETAVSGSQAMGLMQLLPSTAQEVARTEGLSSFTALSLFSPEINVRLGSRYLKSLINRFDGNPMPAVGGYNGGPNAMARWISEKQGMDPDQFVESIPYDQTREYIEKVFASWWNYDHFSF
ncbi:MAG: transglycosylase SLT domain-containing protein [Cyanobacteria bacterium]|nr:transglycosylase SLT domain-containing protein [Cyanobacteriota bacterium]